MWRSGKLSGGDSFYPVLLKEPSCCIRSWALAEFPEDPGNKVTQEEESISVENDRSTKQKLNELVCISSYLGIVINYFLKFLEI